MESEEKPLADPEKLYGFLRRSITDCTELARVLKFDKTHKWHVNLISLYGSMLELANSICVLVEGGSPIGVPILLRSMLEAFVDFSNLAETRTYGYHMDGSNIKEWIRILEEAKRGDNPYLADISKLPNLHAILSDHKKQLKDLKRKGYSPLPQYQKFEKSHQSKEYRSFYNFLCCHAHSNIRSLISRHADIADDESDYELQFFSPTDLDSIVHYIDSCLGILVASTESIHKALGSSMAPKAEQLVAQLSEIRKPWIA